MAKRPTKRRASSSIGDEVPVKTPKPTMPKRPAKRRASDLIVEEVRATKKPKLETAVDPTSSDAAPNGASTELANGVPDRPEEDTSMDIVDKATEDPVKLSKNGRPPIKSLFTPYKPNIPVPAPNNAWGTKPFPGQEGPQPHPDLPPARTSNAATTPDMWEDRKYRFKPGQYHKSFGPMEDKSDGPLLDQDDNLVIKLMDMRPKSHKNPEPRRIPVVYMYENGKPKDWHNEQALKALNDRRREAIWRITQDAPWTEMEREYLATLCSEFPDASILELAERFNYRFKGDFKEPSAFSFDHLHEGRTLESVRHEYLEWKSLYDEGITPTPVRQEGDKTGQKKNNKNNGDVRDTRVRRIFGPKSGKAKDEKDADGQKSPPDPKISKKSKDIIIHSDEADYDEPKLSALDDELLELAGYYNPSQVRSSRSTSLTPSEPVGPIMNVEPDLRRSSNLSPIKESEPRTPRVPEPRRPSVTMPLDPEYYMDLAGCDLKQQLLPHLPNVRHRSVLVTRDEMFTWEQKKVLMGGQMLDDDLNRMPVDDKDAEFHGAKDIWDNLEDGEVEEDEQQEFIDSP